MPLLSSDRIDDLATCRATLQGGSKSFHAAALLLPATIVRRASAVYAFCREADDLIDGGGGATAVADLQRRLDAIYAGRPHGFPADRALATILREVRLPREAFEALLEGFAWDAESRRYETIDDLLAYGARVAGSVGVLMSVAMGRQTPHVLARAADLGVAMQLTNIARDVGEDARMGRLYLPQRWLREAGIDADAFLAAPTFTPAIGGVVQRLLSEATRHYHRAEPGLTHLPVTCRFGIRAASRLYAAIGHEVLRNGSDSVSGRAVVPSGRKVSALLARYPAAPDALHAPALEATRFLVDAALMRPTQTRAPAWWDLRGRTLQVIALFERLERADRGMGAEA